MVLSPQWDENTPKITSKNFCQHQPKASILSLNAKLQSETLITADADWCDNIYPHVSFTATISIHQIASAMCTHNYDCVGLDHSSSQTTDLHNEQSLLMIGFANPSAIRASRIQKYLICNRNNFKIKSSCPFFKWFPVMTISQVTLQSFYNLYINYLNMTCLHLALLKSWPAVYW